MSNHEKFLTPQFMFVNKVFFFLVDEQYVDRVYSLADSGWRFCLVISIASMLTLFSDQGNILEKKSYFYLRNYSFFLLALITNEYSEHSSWMCLPLDWTVHCR